ncbi:MAG: DUF4339 domain-containing protein [Elusimicrobia bacterium]|nr:DUF4339 domain-containing protein [Elusimicrobiota bacterium]
MRFWIYDKRAKKILGPYTVERLKAMPGLLTPDTKVAPEGASRTVDWRKAKDVPVLLKIIEAVGTPEDPQVVDDERPAPPPAREAKKLL